MIKVKELEKLVGKRVLYTSKDKSIIIGGELQFFGFNNLLPSWGFQITLDRLPVTNVDLENDSIIEVKQR